MSELGTGFGERLRESIGDQSVNAFAKKCGIGESSIRNYLSDKVPGADTALKLADAAGVDFEWLVSGRGTKASSRVEYAPTIVQTVSDLPGFTLVPRLDVRASAGNGSLTYGEDTLDYLAFQEGWLRSRGVNPVAARVITATGDSMEETIRDGDVLLVDTSIDRVKDNAIYIVNYGDVVLVKRVHRRFNGSLQLISDNPRYPSEDVSAGEVDLVSIAGRVMWFGRSI